MFRKKDDEFINHAPKMIEDLIQDMEKKIEKTNSDYRDMAVLKLMKKVKALEQYLGIELTKIPEETKYVKIKKRK
jgi:hypothetical protein